jgi:hypothetical protein
MTDQTCAQPQKFPPHELLRKPASMQSMCRNVQLCVTPSPEPEGAMLLQ